MADEHFFNIGRPDGGIPRELAPGITTTVFAGDHAMISVVRVAPGATGTLHDHPEEQWGHCLEGTGIRVQGGARVAIGPGDFWRTPGGMPHTVEAGPDGLLVMDIFAPPRAAYATPGHGFAAED